MPLKLPLQRHLRVDGWGCNLDLSGSMDLFYRMLALAVFAGSLLLLVSLT